MVKLDLSRSELAINGGKPVRSRKWFDNFTTGEDEKAAALRVLDSGYLSLFEGSHTPDPPFSFRGGPEVMALEEEWATYYGCRHSVAVNSATSGLFAAVGALGLGFGDEVIVSPYTMSACALAPLIYGAIPVFADVDARSGCLDPASIAKRISPNTKAILVVHQFGFPAKMDEILALARLHGLRVIEDCAQAHGAHYKGRPVGTLGDIGVFSLNVNKTIQVGEGGVVVTNDDELAYRLQLIRNHGEAVVGPAGYGNITNIAGFNYRMTELNAAIARVQLEKLPELTERRLALVHSLCSRMAGLSGVSVLDGSVDDNDTTPTYYVLPMRYEAEEPDRSDFAAALRAEGIPVGEGYVRPLYLQPLYQERKLFRHGYPFSAPPNVGLQQEYISGTCPVAERMHFKELLVNEHVRPPHSEDDIDDVIVAVRKLLAA